MIEILVAVLLSVAVTLIVLIYVLPPAFKRFGQQRVGIWMIATGVVLGAVSVLHILLN